MLFLVLFCVAQWIKNVLMRCFLLSWTLFISKYYHVNFACALELCHPVFQSLKITSSKLELHAACEKWCPQFNQIWARKCKLYFCKDCPQCSGESCVLPLERGKSSLLAIHSGTCSQLVDSRHNNFTRRYKHCDSYGDVI